MKKQFLLPAVLLVGFATTLTSCKKDNDDAVTPSKQACSVEYILNADDSLKVSYDSQERISKEEIFSKSSGNSQAYVTYDYSSGKIVEKTYVGGDIQSEVNYHLNANDNVEYSVAFDKDASGNNDFDNADTTWYLYDSERHVTRTITHDRTDFIITQGLSKDTSWFTYSGGNLTKEERKIGNAASTTSFYTYGNNDATSEFLVPMPGDASIRNIYGKTSQKLPIAKASGGTTVTYGYTFNSEGYVTRVDETTSGANNRTDIYYNCK